MKEFLNHELNEYEDDKKLNYRQWDTTHREILTTFKPFTKLKCY